MVNNLEGWYKVRCTMAHQGAGIHHRDATKYIFAKDMKQVLYKLKRLRGVKLGPRNCFPTIERLSDEECRNLENVIESTENFSLELARKEYYSGERL